MATLYGSPVNKLNSYYIDESEDGIGVCPFCSSDFVCGFVASYVGTEERIENQLGHLGADIFQVISTCKVIQDFDLGII